MEKIRGIVIDIVKHSDRHNIITLYTRSHGRMSFLSPVGSGKAGRMRNARLSLLCEIESDVRIKNNSDLQLLGSVALCGVMTDIYFNPLKSSLVMFLSEFLNRLLRTSTPDVDLYDYIIQSLHVLDNLKTGAADFHIVFMISLLPFMGIQPNLEDYEPGDFFDMLSGEYVASRPLHPHWIGGEEAAALPMLSRISYLTARRFHFNGDVRRRITTSLLHYYSLSFPGADSLRSLPVLIETFR